VRICLDIQPAVAQRAGVGRYTRALAEHLPALAGSDHLTLFHFDFRRRGESLAAAGAETRTVRWLPGRAAQFAWKTWDWPPFDWFSGPADVFHFPNFIRPPLRRGRSVTTIHDVSFLRFPEHAEPANLAFLRSRIRDTVARSDALLTDSAFSADEIADTLGVPRSRIFPTPLGLAPDLAPPPPERAAADRAALGLDRPYLLHVGTLEPRKNLAFLVTAFDRLAAFDGLLVLAGMRGWKVEPILAAIRAARRAADIRVLDFVPDHRLPSLYAGAELLVFPSLYEGFGLPPLEAMACGAPVLASAIPVLREVLGSAAELVPGFDPDAWAQALAALLADSGRRDDLRRRGREHAARFTWRETARLTWDVYRKVAA
jgi:glycosyltransferase involved in cell wall biosynthesis